MIEESKTDILITFLNFFLNFIILKLLTKFQVSQTEILITFFKFLLYFIILKHLNYH
jgi:hypothetical protein